VPVSGCRIPGSAVGCGGRRRLNEGMLVVGLSVVGVCVVRARIKLDAGLWGSKVSCKERDSRLRFRIWSFLPELVARYMHVRRGYGGDTARVPGWYGAGTYGPGLPDDVRWDEWRFKI